MPRGFVLSSFALPEIAVPSPMSIFQTRFRYCRRSMSTTSRTASRARVANGVSIDISDQDSRTALWTTMF